MTLNHIEHAISNKKVVTFHYDGMPRVVEPHLLGTTKTGNLALRAYQIGGYSSSGVLSWKLFLVEKMSNIQVLNDDFVERPDYNPYDKGMMNIHCRID